MSLLNTMKVVFLLAIATLLTACGDNKLIGNWQPDKAYNQPLTFRAHDFHRAAAGTSAPMTADVDKYEVNGEIVTVHWKFEGRPVKNTYKVINDDKIEDEYGRMYRRR